jgi:hypothetical protein
MTPAPLRRIVETKTGPPHTLEWTDGRVELRTVIHTLECGHTTEPYIRDGCRVPNLPKRRRCRECKPKVIIRGLSLTRPWPFAFVAESTRVEPKRVENRSWPPPTFIVGHYLALHAAQGFHEGDREFIADATGLYVPDRRESPHSEIFAVCRVEGCVTMAMDERLPEGQCPWFFGTFGWLLTDFVKLVEPVKCKGGQKLWTLESKGVLEDVRESYRASAVEAGSGDAR